jgi:hypothetical protein
MKWAMKLLYPGSERDSIGLKADRQVQQMEKHLRKV